MFSNEARLKLGMSKRGLKLLINRYELSHSVGKEGRECRLIYVLVDGGDMV